MRLKSFFTLNEVKIWTWIIRIWFKEEFWPIEDVKSEFNDVKLFIKLQIFSCWHVSVLISGYFHIFSPESKCNLCLRGRKAQSESFLFQCVCVLPLAAGRRSAARRLRDVRQPAVTKLPGALPPGDAATLERQRSRRLPDQTLLQPLRPGAVLPVWVRLRQGKTAGHHG